MVHQETGCGLGCVIGGENAFRQLVELADDSDEVFVASGRPQHWRSDLIGDLTLGM